MCKIVEDPFVLLLSRKRGCRTTSDYIDLIINLIISLLDMDNFVLQTTVRVMVFNAIFNYINDIVAVSFIGGENRSSRRKPQTCRKSLTSLHLAWVGLDITTLVVVCADCIGSCKSNYHKSWTRRPLSSNDLFDFKQIQNV